ncbi:MAG: regulatory protein RecX [Bacteroidales bacterium]
MGKVLDKREAQVKAQNLCAKFEKSKGEIRQKLFEWKVDKSWHNEIIESLVKDKFIDEERFAAFYVRDKYKLNKWGKQKIAYGLRAKEISEEIINQSMNKIEDEEYYEICFDLIRKKLKTLTNELPAQKKEKVLRFALGRGFESNIILKCLNTLLTEQ